MPTSSERCSSTDLLPYRCPACASGKRFRSLIALRLHTTIVHDSSSIVQPQRKSSAPEDSISRPHKLEEIPTSHNAVAEESERNNEDISMKMDDLLSSASVDCMFNKYSARIDKLLHNYDSKSKNLEQKLRLTKQMDEIRKQKEQLNRIQAAWKATHGVSQLVLDTDAIINKSVSGLEANRVQKPSNIHHSEKQNNMVLSSNGDAIQQVTSGHQLELSLQLAAQYKALALDTEEKLKQKIEEEEHLKRYIEVTSRKEQEAKKQLACFLDSLLQRAENAEAKLEMYQKRRSLLEDNTDDAGDYHERYKQLQAHADQQNRSKTSSGSFETRSLSRLCDSGIPPSPKMQAREKRTKENVHVVEPWKITGNHDRKMDKSRFRAEVKRWPFSNRYSDEKNSDLSADRRVALFCVFMQLRSIDLLRCSLICREWRDTARHPQLWSRIRFHDVIVECQLLRLVAKWSQETCSLCLKNVGLMDNHLVKATGSLEEGLEMILKSCADKLLVLSIEQCDPVITSRALWLVSCYNKHIQSISYRSSLDPVSHQVAWALGSTCRDVVSLEIAPLQPCSVRGLFNNNVARLLSWCWPHLQALSFGGIDVDGTGLVAVALNCHRLKVLELDHARGVTEEHAQTACKHGLQELRTLLFTNTPVLAKTLLCFLNALRLHTLHVVVSQKDYFTKSKYNKIGAEYSKISRALDNLQKHPSYGRVVDIHCE